MFNDVWMNDKFTHIKVNDNFKITTLQQMVNGNILTKNKQNNSINGIIVIGNKKCFYKVQEIKETLSLSKSTLSTRNFRPSILITEPMGR